MRHLGNDVVRPLTICFAPSTKYATRANSPTSLTVSMNELRPLRRWLAAGLLTLIARKRLVGAMQPMMSDVTTSSDALRTSTSLYLKVWFGPKLPVRL
jgi:hypothetical protein